MIIGVSTSGPGQAETLRRALQATVDGQPLFSAAQVTWNLLEPSVGPAAAEAAAAGWTILVKEAMANGRLAPSGDQAGPPAQLTALADARNVTTDAIALAAALANPWASVVLSGAVTERQLRDNLRRWTWAACRTLTSPNRPAPTGRPGPPGPGAEPDWARAAPRRTRPPVRNPAAPRRTRPPRAEPGRPVRNPAAPRRTRPPRADALALPGTRAGPH